MDRFTRRVCKKKKNSQLYNRTVFMSAKCPLNFLINLLDHFKEGLVVYSLPLERNVGPDLEEEVSVECSVSNVQAFSTNNEGTINSKIWPQTFA